MIAIEEYAKIILYITEAMLKWQSLAFFRTDFTKILVMGFIALILKNKQNGGQ